MLVGEVLQDHIHLLLCLQTRLLCHETLINIPIVAEQSSIVPQQGSDDIALVGRERFQLVEIIPVDNEMHTRLILLLFRILDISRAHQDLQGRINLNGEMPEGMTELVDIEFMGCASPAAFTNLVEVGEVLIHLPDGLLFRVVLRDSLLEFPLITVVIEQNGV